jgi:hypothetical protein
MMPIIFLDLDGVLNIISESYITSFFRPDGTIRYFEPHLIERLHYIIERVPDLKIVISSSWRSDMKDLKEQLEKDGFKYWRRVIGKTPELNGYKRGDEILKWLEEHPEVKHYRVLEDEENSISPMISYRNITLVDPETGLTHKNVKDTLAYFDLHDLLKNERNDLG